jgi:hypothetical protein
MAALTGAGSHSVRTTIEILRELYSNDYHLCADTLRFKFENDRTCSCNTTSYISLASDVVSPDMGRYAGSHYAERC